ncbi:methyl-accepting chemotaxis protein [Haladaptatus halobius]|uniref:methyl-accepting chemotaxis protein n=1 Tax=Haladaptatus halobius TaxID=2884875 RepID=UPI001D0AE28B|nr:methyl-accepting chemotaxis protein [Haladaptatus halobius]
MAQPAPRDRAEIELDETVEDELLDTEYDDEDANEARDGLLELYESSEEIAESVGEIAALSTDQSTGMRTVATEVSELSAAIQQVAASAEQVSTASERRTDSYPPKTSVRRWRRYGNSPGTSPGTCTRFETVSGRLRR